MKQLIAIYIVFALFFTAPMILLAGTDKSKEPIPTVDHVDLDSYVGMWYEIRRIENNFQDDESTHGDGPCFNTTAEYSFLPKGKIRVKNTCYRQSDAEVAYAKAKAVQGSNNAKLKVNFTGIPLLEWLGIGNGDYWVLALGEKNFENLYSWALVGSPNLKFGWILSRTQDLTDRELKNALSVAESVGYKPELFKPFRK